MMQLQALPEAIDAEKLVLAAAISNSQLYWPAIQDLPPSSFSVDSHKIILSTCRDIYKRGDVIDRVTLSNELHRRGLLDQAGGLSYVVCLDDGMPRLPNVDAYIALVQREARRRQIYLQTYAIHNEAGKPASQLVDLESSIAQLKEGSELTTANQLLTIGEAIEHEGGIDALLGGDPRKVVPTTFPELTEALDGGFRRGELIVLGARPGQGKTVLGLQIAIAAAFHGARACMFSLEMGNRALLLRAACSISGVPLKYARQGRLGQEERMSLASAFRRLSKTGFRISDRAGCTPASLNAALRWQKAHDGLDLGVVDYLGLMSAGANAENRNAEISYITRQLKLTAKELECCLVALSQFSRKNENEKRRPQLHDLRDSGSIEQDADIVMFLHRLPEPNMTDLILAKQRDGWTGDIHLEFEGSCVRFKQAEKPPEDEGSGQGTLMEVKDARDRYSD